MKSILGVCVLWQCVVVAVCGSVPREHSEVLVFGAPAAYSVETSLALNDVAKKDKEVGYKIKGSLHVTPLWAASSDEYLLKFNLINPKLHLRGKHINADFRPFDSIWDSYRDTEFYVHWKSGTILTSYLDTSEPVDITNYKKSLISLFQFQIIDGEYNETDISGTCDVLYDSISSDVFRKIKRECTIPGTETAESSVVSARRVTRYSLGAGGRALQAVYADELLQLGDAALGVKARSWHRLELQPAAPPAAPPLADLAAAMQAVPPHLAPASLALVGDDPDDDNTTLSEVVQESSGALQTEAPGAGGAAQEARALLRLLPALRAADAPALARLLEDDHAFPMLTGLCRTLGLAGTLAAHAAADSFLHLGARDPLVPLALAYLGGLSLSEAPAAAAVAEVARLADEAKAPSVAAAALLAASAAAPRLASDELAHSLRDDVARSLTRCKDDDCRCVRLQALGHLRRADSASLLLEHAERAARAPALAALQALAALPPDALHAGRRRRLERLALRHGPPLEVRATALDLFIARSVPRPLPLGETALALHRHGPVELRRLFWQRLTALAEDHPDVRDVLRMLPVSVRAWPAQAHAGTSMALSRGTGWAAGAWAARLHSLQVAAAGLLRTGRVRLAAHAPVRDPLDLLTVEVWTRGLEAVAGAGAADPALYEEAAADADTVAGGLALTLAGVALPPIDLFTSQAELLGHVWAGTGSTATSVVRGVVPLPTRAGRLSLLGGARLQAQGRAALVLALDAQAQVSLWSRSARAGLQLRAGGAAEARLRVRTAWGSLQAQAAAQAEPRLHIGADLDFYDAVALCVRVGLDDYVEERSSWQESSLGARPLRVRRSQNSTRVTPGRTLGLGRAAAVACRGLTPNDDN